MDLSGSVEDWDAYEKKIYAAYEKKIYAAIEAEKKDDKVSYLLIAFKILGKNLIPYIRLNKLEQYLELQEHLRSRINDLLPEGWEIRISRKKYPGEPYFFRDAVEGRYTEKRVWMGKVLNADNSLNLSILSGATGETGDNHEGGTYNKKKYVRNTKRRHAKRRQSRRQNRH